MLKNYLLTAFRQMRRQTGTSLIHVIGLTLGIASSLLIFLTIWQEDSYDRYHRQRERVFRVETTQHEKEFSFTGAGTPTGVANALRNDFPEVEQVATIHYRYGQLLSVQNPVKGISRYKESVAFVDNELFSLLDYRWLAGNPATALSQPNSAVLSKSMATKLFGNSQAALGKHIGLNNGLELQVNGILEAYPVNTDFAFPVLVSYATIKNLDPQFDFNNWAGWGDQHQTYVLLNSLEAGQKVAERFPAMVNQYMAEYDRKKFAYSLLPLEQVHYHSNLSGHTADKRLLRTLAIVGIFVLLIACINFTNLATAQAAVRAKEVGVRKALGGSRGQLWQQFLSEAGLVTMVAVLLSVLVAYLAMPYVSTLLSVPLTVNLLLSAPTAIFLLLVFLVTSLLSGCYPALMLSRFSAIPGNTIRKFQKGVPLRQSLVVFQFSVSLVLIIGALVMSRQLSFFRNADLGFDKEAIITVELPSQSADKLSALRNRLSQSSQIAQVSFSMNSASSQGNWMERIVYKSGQGETAIRTQMKFVDAQFIPAYGITLLAGEGFREGDTLPKLVVNEVFVQKMGFTHPHEALGKQAFFGDQPLPIIGVVKDFHVNSLHHKIDPTVLVVAPQHFRQAGIKLEKRSLTANHLSQTIKHIEQAWRATFPDQVFSYQFLDKSLEDAYRREWQTLQLIQLATGLAILISCLGLLGLAAHSAQQRTKEIGVRKVLGASVAHIVMLLSRDFLKPVLIAVAIASPIAWWVSNQWLQDFEFKIKVDWWLLALAGSLALFIALLTVSFQSIKAALSNPVDSLRNE